jgi:hypothetical protein
MKLIIMQFSPASYHFAPLKPKYSPQHSVRKYPHSFPQCDTKFHTYTKLHLHILVFMFLENRRREADDSELNIECTLTKRSGTAFLFHFLRNRNSPGVERFVPRRTRLLRKDPLCYADAVRIGKWRRYDREPPENLLREH